MTTLAERKTLYETSDNWSDVGYAAAEIAAEIRNGDDTSAQNANYVTGMEVERREFAAAILTENIRVIKSLWLFLLHDADNLGLSQSAILSAIQDTNATARASLLNQIRAYSNEGVG